MVYWDETDILADLNKTGDTDIQARITGQWGPAISAEIDGVIKPYFSVVPVSPVPSQVTEICNVGVKAKYFEFIRMKGREEAMEAEFLRLLTEYVTGLMQAGAAQAVPSMCFTTAGNVTRST